MKRRLQPKFRKIATIGFFLFTALAVGRLALAGPKGVGSNKDAHDHRVYHDHHHFSLPYWWYNEYGYGYDYDANYWQDLAIKVQLELARRGYYHGPINGVIDLSSRHAILAFQKAHGLVETGLIGPGLLKSLNLPVPQAPSQFS
jgi:Putative peptidoglycan binding domain